MSVETAIPVLTIGIPTFNRARYLCEAIDSIVAQAEENPRGAFNVLISDNDSHDDTEEAVKKYTCRYDFIEYHRNPENIGDDRNGENLLNKAKGKYLWLLGDDDLIEPNGIMKVLNVLKNNQGIKLVLTNWKDVDHDLTVLSPKVHGFEKDILFTEPDKAFIAANLMFGFMSCVIAEKAGLLSIEERKKYFGTHLILMYMIPRLMLQGPTLLVAEPLISFRHNNQKTWEKKDSQLNAFIHSQISLPAIVKEATQTGFSRSAVATVINKGYLRIFLGDIIALKLGSKQPPPGILLQAIKQNCLRPAFWMLFPLLLVPAPLFKMARMVLALGRSHR